MKKLLARPAWHGLCAAALLSACGGGEPTIEAQGRAQPLSVSATPLASIPTYTITNLDLGGGWGSAWSKGINTLGQVVGEAGLAGGGSHAFFFDGSSMIDIGTLGGSRAIAAALNNQGLVTGQSATLDNGGLTAFVWRPGMPMRAITPGADTYGVAVNDSGLIVGAGAAGGFTWTEADGYRSLASTYFTPMAVNASGQMAGHGYDAAANRWGAAIRQPDGRVVSVLPSADYNGFASVINDAGLVGGYTWRAGDPYYYRAFAATDGATDLFGHALATTPNDFSFVHDLNQAGQMIGTATVVDPNTNQVLSAGGFIRSPTGLTSDLGRLGDAVHTTPLAINNNGQVVGQAGSPSLGWRAVTWTAATGLVDLNAKLSNPPPGLFLIQALAISDNGSIVAFSNAGLLLLKPVPSGPPPTAPALGPVIAPSPVALGTSVQASVAFTDVNVSDTHSAVWRWDDGSPSSVGAITETGGSGQTSASHAFTAAGVYKVSVSVTDSSGRTTSVGRDVVVYDPGAGFVTGGGWIHSPIGAYCAEPALAGRADFAFVSKYKRGAAAPNGETEFQFRAARMGFFSNTYDWLVVAGARAQFKGSGALNGKPGYKFLLSAVDGALLAKGTADRFRIKIWHFDAERNADVIDYDNQIDAGLEGGNSEGTAIAGGSIVVQK